ncbi:hypothetical protein IMZ48_14985 [Candidatus Bathyarchaeota archaeon]|nr:hypothetical protein [Candidatus Bathyarchaeota archaeon]
MGYLPVLLPHRSKASTSESTIRRGRISPNTPFSELAAIMLLLLKPHQSHWTWTCIPHAQFYAHTRSRRRAVEVP